MSNKMQITPAFMEYVSHIYSTPAPFPRQEANAFQEIGVWLLDHEMIFDEGEFYTLTDKGHIYVGSLFKALNDVPLPYWSCDKKPIENINNN